MTNPIDIRHAIQNVDDQSSFIRRFLVDALEWPIEDDIEDLGPIAYDWDPAELGIDPDQAALLDGRILQIRPFTGNQPWGVFLMEIEREDVFHTGQIGRAHV